MQQNVTERIRPERTWSMSVAGRLVAGRQPKVKVYQVLLRSATFTQPKSSAQPEPGV